MEGALVQNKPALACTSWATVYARNFNVVGTVPEMAAALCVQVLAQSQRVLLSREQPQCCTHKQHPPTHHSHTLAQPSLLLPLTGHRQTDLQVWVPG